MFFLPRGIYNELPFMSCYKRFGFKIDDPRRVAQTPLPRVSRPVKIVRETLINLCDLYRLPSDIFVYITSWFCIYFQINFIFTIITSVSSRNKYFLRKNFTCDVPFLIKISVATVVPPWGST